MKVKLANGARVWIDFSVYEWRDGDAEFTLGKTIRPGFVDLRAPGYGEKDDYGMGSIFAKIEDLRFVSNPMDNEPCRKDVP